MTVKITKEIIKNIPEDKAKSKKVYNLIDSKYDKEQKQLEFSYNTATGKNFRLVHDGKTAFVIIEGTEKGATDTIHNIEEFKTEKECLDQIEKLGLIYNQTKDIKNIEKIDMEVI